MARFNENNAFLSIGGRDVSGIWSEATITPSNSPVDVTAGAGKDDMQRLPGLNTHELTAILAYDTDSVNDDIQSVKTGVLVRVIYGPEGNTAGKLKHEQDFILTSATFRQTVSKEFVMFNLSGSSANPPVADMYNGDTF